MGETKVTKAILLTDPTRAALNIDTAFELEPEEADGLMFSAVIFFCRHHSEMSAEAGTPVYAYHTIPIIDPDRLVMAIKQARTKREEARLNSSETTTELNMDIWKDVFAHDEPKAPE